MAKELHARQIFGQLSAYTAVLITDRCLSFAVMPLYTRALTPSMYGTMELLDLTTSIVGMIVAVRLTEALAYFFHSSNDLAVRRRFLGTAMTFSLILGALLAALMGVLAHRLSELVFGSDLQAAAFRLLAISLSSTLPAESALGIFRVAGMSRAFALAAIARSLTTAVLMLILVVHLRLGVTGWLWSSASSAVIVGGITVAYTIRIWGLQANLAAGWKMFRYSWPLNISAMAMFFIHFGDRWFLRRHISLDELGVYSFAYKFGMMIAYVQAPFSLFWGAQMFAVNTGDGGRERHVRVATYVALIYGAATVFVSTSVSPFLQIWAGAPFRGAALFVPVVAMAYMVRAEGEFFRSAFRLNGRTRWDAFVTTLGAACCLAGYLYLVPRLGSWGAIAATFGTFVVMLGLSIWKGQQVSHYPYEWRKLATIGGLTAAFSSIPLVLRPASTSQGVLQFLLATTTYALALRACGALGDRELTVIRNFCSKGLRTLSTQRGVQAVVG